MIFQTKLNGSRILHQALIPETVAINDGRRVAQKKHDERAEQEPLHSCFPPGRRYWYHIVWAQVKRRRVQWHRQRVPQWWRLLFLGLSPIIVPFQMSIPERAGVLHLSPRG